MCIIRNKTKATLYLGNHDNLIHYFGLYLKAGMKSIRFETVISWLNCVTEETTLLWLGKSRPIYRALFICSAMQCFPYFLSPKNNEQLWVFHQILKERIQSLWYLIHSQGLQQLNHQVQPKNILVWHTISLFL